MSTCPLPSRPRPSARPRVHRAAADTAPPEPIAPPADLPMFPLGADPGPVDSDVFPRPRRPPVPRPPPPPSAFPAPPTFPVPPPVLFATPPVDDGRRAESFRAFAVMALVLALSSSVMVGAVLMLVAFDLQPRAVPAPVLPPIAATERLAQPPTVPSAPSTDPVDAPAPLVERTVRPPAVVRSASAPAGPAPVTITLAPGAPPFSSFSVNCASSGFRKLVPFVGGTGTMPDVPRTDCVLHFRGVGALPKIPVAGGTTLTCSFVGSAPDCR